MSWNVRGHDGSAYVEGYEAARHYLEARRLDPDSVECREQERTLRALELGDSLYPADVADHSYSRGFRDFLFLTRQHARNVLDDLAELHGNEKTPAEAGASRRSARF